MAWDNTLVDRLRYYIGDIDTDSQVWSNTQLAKLLAIAAVDVLSEVSLIATTFTINSETPSISPDPVTSSTVDAGVPALFVLRAAFIVSLSEMRKDVSKYGVRIKDGQTSIDGSDAIKGRKDVLNLYKENYERAVWEWEKGNRAACRAILGPYSSADNPQFSSDYGRLYSNGGKGRQPYI
jgi:hypothetical protein